MKLAYFVHDLTDPAVGRRVRMLRAGGAEPLLLGFRRAEAAPETVEGAPAIDLGRTHDGRLGHRAAVTALTALRAGRWRARLAGCQVFLARTLEMLSIARAARPGGSAAPRLVYECLDIHRLMLAPGRAGQAMRAVERALLRQADLLIVSSPAFIEAYFGPVQGVGTRMDLPVRLVENKVLELEGPASPAPRPPPPVGPPWRIGWMGALRCRRSLDILSDLAARRPDLVEIRLHGRPAYGEFADFDARVRGCENLSFHGPYSAADLPRLYGDVHFSWAIDYMEAGQNSSWLLPNRLYEASRYGALPVALADVETGRRLMGEGFGVVLGEPGELEGVLEALTAEGYAELRARLEAVPASAFAADDGDCRALVAALAGAPPASHSHGRGPDGARAPLAA